MFFFVFFFLEIIFYYAVKLMRGELLCSCRVSTSCYNSRCLKTKETLPGMASTAARFLFARTFGGPLLTDRSINCTIRMFPRQAGARCQIISNFVKKSPRCNGQVQIFHHAIMNASGRWRPVCCSQTNSSSGSRWANAPLIFLPNNAIA